MAWESNNAMNQMLDETNNTNIGGFAQVCPAPTATSGTDVAAVTAPSTEYKDAAAATTTILSQISSVPAYHANIPPKRHDVHCGRQT